MVAIVLDRTNPSPVRESSNCMLIRYKKCYRKIAMGLLSFTLNKRDIKSLQKIVDQYENNPNWHLYLWKQSNNIIGAIGFKIKSDVNVIIQHVSVNPSYRSDEIGYKMIHEIIKQYGHKYDILPNNRNQNFFQLMC
ncbi:GNAT family N-acetyltransferase [Virgibacillus siamensis]|uniref:GNAT family N-acetyltransferase n=1 Tax=Virgibacillus siamensis TaxID=480071 RepID=UPI001FE998F1|nr:GNAT family N-acetyltransferase [Virgibacillus siamensis]